MVLRYTRTRSVDTRPEVSDSRRGARTSRVSLGEDCNSVTVCLRPCLLVRMRRHASSRAVHPAVVVLGGFPGWPGRPLALCGPVWYVVHNGPDGAPCSAGARITANP